MDIFIIQTNNEYGFTFIGNPIFGYCQKVKDYEALRYAISDGEMADFIEKYGTKYLNIQGLNYFLNFSDGKYYLAQVDREGQIIRKNLFETVPYSDFITIFLKKQVAT